MMPIERRIFLAKKPFREAPNITVMHAVPFAQPHWLEGALVPESYREELQAGGEALTNQTVSALASLGYEAVPLTLDGSPVELILKVAHEKPPDVLLVGTHGRKGFSRFCLGSVAHAVIHRVSCSVLVLRWGDLEPIQQIKGWIRQASCPENPELRRKKGALAMKRPEDKQQGGSRSWDGDLARLKLQLEMLRGILSKHEAEPSLKEFDAGTEQVIGEVFGSVSEMMEAYSYAQLGEAGGLMNLPEEAQGPGEQDAERLSFHQREQVLEQCIAELEARRTRLTKK